MSVDINHFIRSPSNLLVLRVTFQDNSVREIELNKDSAVMLSDVLYSYAQMAFESKPAPVLQLAKRASAGRSFPKPAEETQDDCTHDAWVHTESGQSYCRECGLVCKHPVFKETAVGTMCKECGRPFEVGR